ncbi:MAG: MBOAT family protein [Spirulina sp. SIO3F2]|nr:MBOAT family protein [Spirulina sp. SIO3F2]
MTFLDPIYGLFLLLLIVGYWHPALGGGRDRYQLGIVLGASLLFYSLLQIQYVPLMVVLVVLNFYLGRLMARQTGRGLHPQYAQLSNEEWDDLQRLWMGRMLQILIVGIVLNVLFLGGFKYLALVTDGLAQVVAWPWLTQQNSGLLKHFLIPLGISFFTFENIAYLVDVYRGAPAAESLLEFGAYKFFFPKLISGPITRFHPFISQFKEQQQPNVEQFTEGLWLFASGAIKKALIADPLGMFVDLCFGNMARAGSVDLWLAVLAYGLQLYFDFSGYVDMARGSALFLGFKLPENFNFPYFTTSIASFWRRWHITLGDWLRNYLYFPLGGSRQSLARTCFNLWFIMFIAGIWHIDANKGTAWGYLIWGILHGVALIAHRLTDVAAKHNPNWADWWVSLPGTMVAWLVTQLFVFMSWVFFRLPDLAESSWVVTHLFGVKGDVQFSQKVYAEALGLARIDLVWLMVLVVLMTAIAYLIQRGLQLQLNWHLKLLLVPLCFLAVWLLAPEGGTQYIYFDF